MDPILAESKLAYHGLRMTSTDPVRTGVNPARARTDQTKSLIKTFLEDIGFDRSIRVVKDNEMKIAVWQYFQSLDLGEKNEKSVHQTLVSSLNFAYHGYTSLPFQVRVLGAIRFLYMFLVDDVAEEFIEELQAFGQNFALNKHHKHPILAGLDSHLRDLSNYYGPYCHSVMIKGMLDYINGRVIEHKIKQSNFKFSSESRLMPMFLRTKEFCLDDETGNFVADFADTHHIQHLDVLRYLTSYTPPVTKSAYEQLRNSPSLLALVKDFTQGMIMLFTAQRRYYLVELFADEQYLPPYNEDA
ncbi:unnamed protein product [Penicillium viridicatum]